MGLSYSYQIADLKQPSRTLQPQDLHSHWVYPQKNIPQPPAGDETGEEIIAAMDILNHYRGQNFDFRESDRNDLMNVEEPAIVRGKGRPSGKRNKKKKKSFDYSTNHEPSAS